MTDNSTSGKTMAEAWYYQRGDQRLGPVSSQELKRLANTGELQPTDLLWKEGMPQPRAASMPRDCFPAPFNRKQQPRRPRRVPQPPPYSGRQCAATATTTTS